MTYGVRRLSEFGETIFATMSARATELDALNLGQGFPDDGGPAPMLQRAQEEIAKGNNQYAPGKGVFELREAVARHQKLNYGVPATAEDVLITVGATEAIAATIMGLVEPTQEIIVLEPYYDSYAAAIALAGATRVPVPLRRCGNTWDLDPDAVANAITDKTAMIIVNSPHNPTGSVFTEHSIKKLAELAKEQDILVLSDEVYEHLTFDVHHINIASLPGMWERTITVSSAAKTFNVTGWKTGWAVAPSHLLAHVTKAKQFLTYVGATPFQPAVAYALEEEQPWVEKMRTSLSSRKELLVQALSEAGIKTFETHGTYFVLAEAPEQFESGTEFATFLLEEHGIATIPVEVFSDHKEPWRRLIRFTFCKNEETMQKAAEAISKISF